MRMKNNCSRFLFKLTSELFIPKIFTRFWIRYRHGFRTWIFRPYQATAGRRRPRRPGFQNSLFPFSVFTIDSKVPSYSNAHAKFKLDFWESAPRKLVRVRHHCECFWKLYHLGYSDLSFIRWVQKSFPEFNVSMDFKVARCAWNWKEYFLLPR